MSNDLPAELLARIAELKRTAWLPETLEKDDRAACSKFGGTPWLLTGEAWPACPRCGKPMALFLQLDLGSLPEEVQGALGEGLLQMFYCVSSSECPFKGEGALSPFSPYQLVRRIEPSHGEPAAGPAALDQIIPARSIVGWKPIDDYPNSYELYDLGFDLEDETADALYDRGLTANQSDKLFGWPAWVQNVDYPKCRVCGRSLWLIFELESQQNLWYTFGDDGCGQITGCPDHREELAFAWQCF
jgi:hypothetical protein